MTFNLLGPWGHEMFDVDRMRADSKWLLFVCVMTSFVLIFQLVAGAVGKSDALIADSAHTSVDLITYFLNFYVEYRKTKHFRFGNSYDAFGVMQDQEQRRLDLRGSTISTFLLVTATGWASKEAIDRLTMPDELKPAANFAGIGPSMLSFSVMSAAAGVFTLWAHGTGLFEKDLFGSTAVAIELPSMPSDGDFTTGSFPDMSPTPYKEYTSPTSSTNRNNRGNSPTSVEANMSASDLPGGLEGFRVARPDPDTRRAKRKARKQGGLNLRADFSNEASPCMDRNCTDSGCAAPGRGHAENNAFMALVHTIVHPGCQHGNGKKEPQHNLNVFGAVLHVVADVLRSVAILVVAILIQTGWVQDPADADAVCALFVAAFVILGSLTLIIQMAHAAWHFVSSEVPEEADCEMGLPISPEQSYV